MALGFGEIPLTVTPGFYQGMADVNALTASNISNRINNIKAQYAPQQIQSEISYKNALANAIPSEINERQANVDKIRFLLNHPAFMAGGAPRDIEALKLMGIFPKSAPGPQIDTTSSPPTINPSGEDNNIPTSSDAAPFNTGNSLIDTILNRPYASTAYQRRMTEGWDWVHTPVDAQNYEIALGAGMGISPDDLISRRSHGQSIKDIARSYGFDPNNLPDPDYLPTRGNIQTLKQRQAALKELGSLDKFISDGLGPYSRTINRFSPLQIRDSLLNMKEDQQMKFLAARALAPESANLRLMVAQARTGQRAIQSMMDKSLTNINAFQGLVSQEIYEGAQKMIEKELTDMFSQANKAYVVGRNNNQKIPMKSRDGKIYDVPPNKVQKFIDNGFLRI